MCRPEPRRSDSPYPGRGFRRLTQALSASACQPLATVRDTSHVSSGFSRLVLPREAAGLAGRRLGGELRERARRSGGRTGAAAARSCRDGRGVGPGHRARHGPGGKRARRGHCRGGPEGDPRHRAGEPGHTRYGGLLTARSRREGPERPRAQCRRVGHGAPGTQGYGGAVAAGSRRDGYEGRPAASGVTTARSRRSNAQPRVLGPQQPPFGKGRAKGAGTGETDPLSRTCRPAPHSPAPSTAHTAAAAHPAPAP